MRNSVTTRIHGTPGQVNIRENPTQSCWSQGFDVKGGKRHGADSAIPLKFVHVLDGQGFTEERNQEPKKPIPLLPCNSLIPNGFVGSGIQGREFKFRSLQLRTKASTAGPGQVSIFAFRQLAKSRPQPNRETVANCILAADCTAIALI